MLLLLLTGLSCFCEITRFYGHSVAHVAPQKYVIVQVRLAPVFISLSLSLSVRHTQALLSASTVLNFKDLTVYVLHFFVFFFPLHCGVVSVVLCVYSASRVSASGGLFCLIRNSVQQEEVEEFHVFFSSIGLRDFIGIYLKRVLLLLLLPFEDFWQILVSKLLCLPWSS
jgi:energy-converting hydrogenase Eha subunit G